MLKAKFAHLNLMLATVCSEMHSCILRRTYAFQIILFQLFYITQDLILSMRKCFIGTNITRIKIQGFLRELFLCVDRQLLKCLFSSSVTVKYSCVLSTRRCNPRVLGLCMALLRGWLPAGVYVHHMHPGDLRVQRGHEIPWKRG